MVTWEPEAVELGSCVIGVGTLVALATVATVREHTLPSHLGCTHQLHARPLVARASAGVARSPSSTDELVFLLSAQQTHSPPTKPLGGVLVVHAHAVMPLTHHRLLSGWWQVVFKARSGEVDSALHVAVFNLVECALVWLVAIEAGVDVGSFRWALLYVSRSDDHCLASDHGLASQVADDGHDPLSCGCGTPCSFWISGWQSR